MRYVYALTTALALGSAATALTLNHPAGAQTAHPFKIIQSKGPGGNVAKYRGGPNGCSVNDNTDYSSTWSGTITVRPGYIAA